MSFYPIDLHLLDKSCAVIGGGKVAWRKAAALLKAGAAVTVLSPSLIEAFAVCVQEKKIIYRKKYYEPGDLAGFFLVICATDQPDVNRQAAIEAKGQGALVNVVDKTYPSDFSVPAQICRGDLLLTVSTGGRSPALARQIRRQLEEQYGEEYGVCLEMIAVIRQQMKGVLAESDDRVLFWQKAMNQEILNLIKQGKLNKAEAEIKNAIGSFRTKSQDGAR